MISQPNILVVDDNSAIHEDFRKILVGPKYDAELEQTEAALFGTATAPAPISYRVDFAGQGRDAFEMVKSRVGTDDAYALAFVDMRMPPGWDGVETIEKLWSVDPNLQVVICTAYTDASWDELIERFGVLDRLLILKKPFDPIEVRQLACALTKKWLVQRSARSEMCELQRLVDERTQQLRSQLARFQALVENSGDAISLTGADGKTTYMSPAITKMLGYAPAELEGQTAFGFVLAEDRAQVRTAYDRLMAAPELPVEIEFRALHRDGSQRFIAATGTNLLGHPAVGAIVGNFHDVTQRRLTEEALRSSEARFRMLFESSPLPKWLYEVETLRFLEVNDAAVKHYGYSHEEFLEMTLDDIRAYQTLPAASNGADHSGIRQHRKKDGTLFDVDISSCAFTLDGRSCRLVVGQDVTQRKSEEQARADLTERLQRSEEAHRLMFEGSPVPMFVFDSETLRFVAANENCLQLYGYSRDELLAMTLPELRVDSTPALLKALTDERPWKGSAQHRKRDGSEITVEIASRPINFAARSARLAVVKDVTQQQHLETQLRQSQKMEAVGRLAGGIAHDFNNVLSVILSYGEMMREDLKPDDPIREDVDEICKAAVRASALTRQLLMFSRQQVIQPRVLNLNEVLADADKMLRRIVGEDIDVSTRLQPDLCSVKIDPGGIEQVIMNLVVNARDAMKTGGKLTIETTNVLLDDERADHGLSLRPGRHVLLTVSDTGTGMDEQTQARLFEPFFTTKAVGEGTGLGLATVFGIVQQSSGGISVYSQPGLGTTFKIYLPCVDARAEAAAPSPSPALGGTETILLVEDEEQVRVVARGILRRNSYHVLEARNAGEALLLCERHPEAIDLLLTDVVMPQMSGAELAKRLAKTRPAMKVLCMSGYTDDSALRHGILDSKMPFLQKPITPDTLLRKVREVLTNLEPDVSALH